MICAFYFKIKLCTTNSTAIKPKLIAVNITMQACIVCGKVGQKHCARYVTDALTGQDTEEQCVYRQQFSEEIAHCRDACQVSAEDEKGTEGGKEWVVDFLDGLSVHK